MITNHTMTKKTELCSWPVLTLMPQAFRVPFLCTNVLRMLFCVESPDPLEQGEKPSDDDKSH